MPESVLSSLSVVTPPLRALLAHYRAELSPSGYESFTRHLSKLSAGYRARLEACGAGAERARAVHELLEAELKNSAHLANSCTRGCSACCHYEVEITKDEGELLALRVLEGHVIDLDRLKVQARRERKHVDWGKRLAPENACVFLDSEGSCSIYEDRPGVCRKALVTTPASFCADESKTTEPILIPLAELILSTALSLPDNSYASLSKSVAAGLVRFAELKERSQELSTGSPELLAPPSDASEIGRDSWAKGSS